MSETVFLAALSSTALISLAPNLLLICFPKYASGEGANSPLLTFGQALAAGGLLGDVFLHTIPHAGGSHDVGLWVLLGFSVFLISDMILRSLGAGHSHKEKVEEDHPNHQHHHKSNSATSTVLLNLAADAMHNFTDGLAIGASFSVAAARHPNASFSALMKSRGGLATLSILFHEIPHELGDFAILVKNGYSKRQAILAQFGTALAAMLGTIVGLVLQDVVVGSESLLFFTAGGFVYLAACTIIPEILEEESSFKFRMAQILAFALGIAFLYAVSLLEEMDEHGHGHSHGHGHGHGHHVDHQEHDHQHHMEEVMEDHHDHSHAHHHHD